MTIYFYKFNKLKRILKKFLDFLMVEIFLWESLDNSLNSKILPFPPSEKYVDLMQQSRIDMNQYFSTKFQSYKLNSAEKYFRKFYDLRYLEYFSFENQIKKLFPHNKKKIILGGGFCKNIYSKYSGTHFFFPLLFVIKLVYSFIFVTLYFFKAFILSCKSINKIKPNSIIYLRKKPYPDLGMKDDLEKKLIKNNYGLTGLFSIFSNKDQEYGFYYLNCISGSCRRALDSYLYVLSICSRISKVVSKNKIPLSDLSEYLRDIFLAKNIALINSKIFVGVLVDKPIHSILKTVTSDKQLVMGINESFFYPPFRSFDYNNLDVYFSLNEIDENLQNKFGGEIKKFQRVSFIRSNLKSTSGGISRDLNQLIKKFQNVCIVATMQVSETGYIQWSKTELKKLLDAVKEMAQVYPNHLFILKGKKNELSHYDEFIKAELDIFENVYVIHSIKPRMLKFNQFEDLLDVANLVVSMSHTSTTIWQSISKLIPVIAINDAHPNSFLHKFSHVEVKSKNLLEAYRYWHSIDENQKINSLSNIKKEVELGKSNGINMIAEYISELLQV